MLLVSRSKSSTYDFADCGKALHDSFTLRFVLLMALMKTSSVKPSKTRPRLAQLFEIKMCLRLTQGAENTMLKRNSNTQGCNDKFLKDVLLSLELVRARIKRLSTR